MPAAETIDPGGALGVRGTAAPDRGVLTTLTRTPVGVGAALAAVLRPVALGLLAVTLASPASAGLGLGGQVVDRLPEEEPAFELSNEGAPLAGVTVELFPLLDAYQAGVALLDEAQNGAQNGAQKELDAPQDRPSPPGTTTPRPVDATTTDGEGFFRVEAPEAGQWLLRLSAPGRATRDEVALAYLEEEEHDPLGLAEARKVTVRVLDPAGRPVAGARVVSRMTPGEPRKARVARTDEEGRVTVMARAGEPLGLAAQAPGLAAAEELQVEGATAVLRLRAGLPVLVEVLDPRGPGSLPVSDALVWVGEPGLPVGRTDDNGKLEILAPTDAPLQVRAVAPDLRSARSLVEPPPPKDEKDDSHPELPPVHLRLEPLATVSGRVIDAEDRSPVVGALLWAPDGGEALAFTDRAGGYRLELPEPPDEHFGLTVLHPGYQPNRSRIRPEQLGGRLPTLPLQPASAIAGQVVSPKGEPVKGARIRVLGRIGRPRGRARSGGDGRFVTGPLAPGGPVQLLVDKPGYAPASETIAVLAPRQTLTGVQVVLQRGRPAQGSVMSREEEPVVGAEVSLVPHLGDATPAQRFTRFRNQQPSLSAVTDTRGEFTAEHVAAGSYDLHVEASGFAPAEVPGLEIPEGEGPFDVGTVVLETALFVRGRVVDPAGQPLEGARVQALSPRSGFGGWRREGPGSERQEATTGPDGRFAVGDFRQGDTVGLSVSRPGFASRLVRGIEIPTSEPVKIVLQPGARIEGKVVDARDHPIEGAHVRTDFSGAAPFLSAGQSRARTDAEGRFSLTDVPPGEVTVQAQAEGYLNQGLIHLDVAPGAVLEDVEIVLERGATVAGRVESPAGEPLPEAHVTLVQGGSGYRIGQSGSTDGDGEFQLEGIPVGLQTFTASHESFPPETRELEVRAGDNRLDFRLEEGRKVSGHARTSDGEPIAGASLWLHSMSMGRGRQALSATDGSFTFEGIGDGTYFLRGRHPEHGDAAESSPVTVAGADVTGLELRFGGRGRILGEIVGLGLDQLADVEVYAFGGTGGGRWAQPDFEGRFELDKLSPGTWNVVASTPGGRRVQESVELPEEAPEAEVTLRFEEGFTVSGRVLLGDEPLTEGFVSLSNVSQLAGMGAGAGRSLLGPDGRFRIEGLSAGSYRLQVSNGRGLSHQEEVEVTTDRDLLVELSAGRLTGRVLDAVTQEPLAGVQVQLEPEDASPLGFAMTTAGTVTDVTGAFRLTSVTPGSYRLVLTRDGYGRAERPVTLEASDSASVEVRMEPSESLTLQLQWAPGVVPSPWVTVVALRPDGRPGDSLRAPVGERGTARLTRLAAGTWDLHVSAAGSALTTVRATVPGPTVPVLLTPEARLDVSVPDLLEGGALARIEVFDAAGRALPLYNDRSVQPLLGGRTVVTRLPAGLLTVRVTADDGRTWTGSTTTVAGQLGSLALEQRGVLDHPHGWPARASPR